MSYKFCENATILSSKALIISVNVIILKKKFEFHHFYSIMPKVPNTPTEITYNFFYHYHNIETRQQKDMHIRVQLFFTDYVTSTDQLRKSKFFDSKKYTFMIC